jgi:hypothetical protein
VPRNIEFTQILSGSLRMQHRDIYMWRARMDELPECSPLEGLPDTNLITHNPDAYAELKHFSWHGEGSGSCFDDTLESFVATLVGEADILLVWSQARMFSGLRIKDGRFVEHEVTFALGAPLP